MTTLPQNISICRNSLLSIAHEHPQHALPPFYRQQLYALLETAGQKENTHPNGWLAFITAEQVLPLWETAMPHDKEPRQILGITYDFLCGNISKEVGVQRWYQARRRFGVDVTAASSYFIDVPWSAICAAHATLYAFLETQTPHPFLQFEITEDETDANIDPWSHDTAQWAVEALAEGVWKPDSDSNKRHIFWNWWLTTALETAWAKH
jgi:Immunity protein Imm5